MARIAMLPGEWRKARGATWRVHAHDAPGRPIITVTRAASFG